MSSKAMEKECQLPLVKDCPTRWSCTYQMIVSYLKPVCYSPQASTSVWSLNLIFLVLPISCFLTSLETVFLTRYKLNKPSPVLELEADVLFSLHLRRYWGPVQLRKPGPTSKLKFLVIAGLDTIWLAIWHYEIIREECVILAV